MAIEDWNGLRKKWVKARDAAKPKVPMGAVKGISVGDAIDAVYKAARKDYATAHAAVKKLLSDLATYKTAIKPKNPNLVTWIDANIEGPAKKLLTGLESDVKTLQQVKKFYGKFNERSEAYFPSDLKQLATQVEVEGKSLKAIKPEAYKSLVEATKFYSSIGKLLGTTATGLKVSLPRKSDTRKELKECAASIAHNANIATALVQASDGPGFEQKLRGDEVIFDMLWDLARDGYSAVDQVLGR